MGWVWLNRYREKGGYVLWWMAILGISFFSEPEVGEGANLARLFQRAANVADNVPIRRLDEVMEETAQSRAGREVLEKLSGIKRLDDPLEHSRAIRKVFQEAIGRSDGAILKQVDALPRASQEAAVVLAHGGRRLKEVVPDLALRGRLIREGGAEILSALGRVDDLGEDLVRFDTALKAGNLPSPPGMRPITLQDFGRFFHTQGERASHFWNKYVRPYWKLWVGTAALAAVLLAPEEYIDKVGDLTEEGLKKIGRLGGEILAGALAGAVKGAGEAVKNTVEKTGQAVVETFFTSPAGIVAAVLIVLGVMLCVPPMRRILSKVVRFPFTRWRRIAQSAVQKSGSGEQDSASRDQGDAKVVAGSSQTAERSVKPSAEGGQS
jgi:hypothetical protein